MPPGNQNAGLERHPKGRSTGCANANTAKQCFLNAFKLYNEKVEQASTLLGRTLLFLLELALPKNELAPKHIYNTDSHTYWKSKD